MKKIIEESGMTLKEFSYFYEIPYNTVRQWYNEERKAPKYVINLLKAYIENNKQGTQLSLFP